MTNSHQCSSYCIKDGKKCKSFFPFYPQERASLAQTNKNPEDSRFVPLAPRNNTGINSTHPMLPTVFHANTVIFGDGVAASCYVMSYGVKLKKQQYASDRLLDQLKSMGSLWKTMVSYWVELSQRRSCPHSGGSRSGCKFAPS